MISSPNYLKHRLLCEANRTGMKIHIPETLSETIDLLRNIYNQGVLSTSYEPMLLVRDGFSKESRELLEIIANDYGVRNNAIWIFTEIFLNIKEDSDLTSQIKTRIISSAMDKLLPKHLYIYFCDSLIESVKCTREALILEQLPFQVISASP